MENIKNFKIIIVDNAGNVSLKSEVEKKFKIYKYILNKKNYGYAKAANQAIKQCDTEYILMFQADGLISNKDISILLESHKKYKNCFITSPTYYDEESKWPEIQSLMVVVQMNLLSSIKKLIFVSK